MKVKAIIERKGTDIYSISPDATMGEMVQEMLARRIGSLLVLNDDGSLAGIITERDFLREVAGHKDQWASVRVGDVMTTELVTTSFDEKLEEVLGKMSKNRVRHMPVIEEGKVAGLLSVVDIINALHEETKYQNQLLKRYIQDWPEEDEGETAAPD